MEEKLEQVSSCRRELPIIVIGLERFAMAVKPTSGRERGIDALGEELIKRNCAEKEFLPTYRLFSFSFFLLVDLAHSHLFNLFL